MIIFSYLSQKPLMPWHLHSYYFGGWEFMIYLEAINYNTATKYSFNKTGTIKASIVHCLPLDCSWATVFIKTVSSLFVFGTSEKWQIPWHRWDKGNTKTFWHNTGLLLTLTLSQPHRKSEISLKLGLILNIKLTRR